MSSAQKTPDKGLEPLTLGLKVPRSTDWANRAISSYTAHYKARSLSINPSLY